MPCYFYGSITVLLLLWFHYSHRAQGRALLKEIGAASRRFQATWNLMVPACLIASFGGLHFH